MTLEIPKQYRRLFPLTLAPVDLLFFLDDFPDYPMTFFIELGFSGTLDPGRFQEALEESVARHPLLFSRVESGRLGRLSWVPDSKQSPQVTWQPWDSTLECSLAEEAIDLRTEPGLRTWVRHDPDRSLVTMQFHHAVCDGTGAYRFIGDLLVAYFRRLDETRDKVDFGESDWRLLRHRRGKMGDLSEHKGTWRLVAPALREWLKYARRIDPVTPPATPPQERSFPNLAVHNFSAGTSKRLRSTALQQNAMLNDLLICEFFRTLSEWNGRHGRIRVMVPSDMRTGAELTMPAANMTAYTFLTRMPREIDDPDLLASVCRDTMEIKRGDPQRRFMDSMAMGTGGPKIFRRIMGLNRCLATAVLSNAGDPSKRFLGRLPRRRGVISGGGLALDSITGAPPVRRNTRASLSASSYGRRLALTARCDPRLFSPEDSRKFLECYAERLQQAVGEEEEVLA